MTIYTISFSYDDENHRAQVDLSDDTFNMVYYYNHRAQAWFFDTFDAAKNPIQLGKRMVSNVPLWRLVNTVELPGELVVYNGEQRPTDPVLPTDVGARMPFIFIDNESLNEAV